MPTAFITYRRADTREAAIRLYDRLVRDLGERHVFIDLYGVDAGADFVERLDQALGQSHVCVIVIGPNWLARLRESTNPRGQEQDYVRLEVSRAIEKGLRLLPVLVDGASMPSPAELPADLAPLATIQAVELRHTTATQDLDRIAAAVRGHSVVRVAGWTLVGALAAYMAVYLIGDVAVPRGADGQMSRGDAIGLGALSRGVSNALLVYGISEGLRYETGLDRGRQLRIAAWCACLGVLGELLVPALAPWLREVPRWIHFPLFAAIRWAAFTVGVLLGLDSGQRRWSTVGIVVVAAVLGAAVYQTILWSFYDPSFLSFYQAFPERVRQVFPRLVAGTGEWTAVVIALLVGFRGRAPIGGLPLGRLIGLNLAVVPLAVIARESVYVLFGPTAARLGVGWAFFWMVLVTFNYLIVVRLRRTARSKDKAPAVQPAIEQVAASLP